MSQILDSQSYELYTPEDHDTWTRLNQRASQLHDGRVSKVFMDGYNQLKFDDRRIVNLEDLSSRMEAISGWTLIPVSGLIPTMDFFYMLINKKYPITATIRKPHEIDFSEQPDIFHDVYGHLPLLLNEKFMKFITIYSSTALEYVDNERVVEYLGRLYWYTYEMGLIAEDGDYKPYGAAIITSANEIRNTKDDSIPKHTYSIDQIFQTPYNPFDLQKEYFVISSFDELFESVLDLDAKIRKHLVPALKEA